eukprot:751231-Hanusia_phi.AAC.11
MCGDLEEVERAHKRNIAAQEGARRSLSSSFACSSHRCLQQQTVRIRSRIGADAWSTAWGTLNISGKLQSLPRGGGRRYRRRRGATAGDETQQGTE